MTIRRLFTMNCTAVVAAMASFLMANTAYGHVSLDAPNGGETLEVGSTFTVTWHILIAHNLQNWDLWYSTTGPGGPWIPIATDLPAGSGEVGSIHTFDWVVPDTPSEQARVRVRMDNSGTDYYDISFSDFTIVPAPAKCPWDLDGGGDVGIGDLLILLAEWGNPYGIPDLLAMLAAWGACP